MSLATHVVSSELAYDLVQDHTETLLHLLDRPLAKAELVERLGSERTLERFVKHGLLAADGDRFRAVAPVYQQLRQEGMMSFLQRYILPTLTASLSGESVTTTLAENRLCIDEATMRGLRAGPVRELFNHLTAISDQAAHGPLARLTVLVVGTSRVLADGMPAEESAVLHLREASLQRANDNERDLAVLTQIDFLADQARHEASKLALERLVQELAPLRATSPSRANYHLTIASHWQAAQAKDRDPAQTSRKSC